MELIIFLYRIILKPFLKTTHRRKLIDLKYRFYFKKSFSQFGEDLVVYNFFENKKTAKKYLDIGAYHPIMLSNSHILHLNNWSGVIVDTEKFKLDMFLKYRKSKVEVLGKAVVSNFEKVKKLPFYLFDLSYSLIDTLSKEFAEEVKKREGINFREEKIDCIQINELLKLDDFNFVNIDIEGMDDEIVSSINFNDIYKPEVIVFEIHNPFEGNHKSINHLIENGYKHLFTSGLSVGFYLN